MSIRPSPSSSSHVICQLRNDWIVVVDFLSGAVLKLHTFLKGESPRSSSLLYSTRTDSSVIRFDSHRHVFCSAK